jgi:uncharacterized protein YecE (DUF72 family)
LHKDLDLLEAFIKLLPQQPPAVFEFRHKSWFSRDTFKILGQSGVAFCIHDMPGIESPRVVTADIIYVRFHGPTGRYAGSYSKASLQRWAKWLKELTEKVRGIYVYFNNDIRANAVRNAETLKKLLAC